MNGQVLDLYSYMKFHKADIAKDCSPSCDPNPCKNNGLCAENWGSYKCVCQNPFAHTGEHCEIGIYSIYVFLILRLIVFVWIYNRFKYV